MFAHFSSYLPALMIDFSITTCHTVPFGRYYKTSDFARTPCEAGYRCVAGVRSACSSDNEYQNGTQSNSCVTVTTGYYTTPIGGSAHTGQTQCEPGYYCAGGVRWVCSGHNEYVTYTHSANNHRVRGCENIARCSRFCWVVQRLHRSIQSGCALVSTLFIARVGLVFTIFLITSCATQGMRPVRVRPRATTSGLGTTQAQPQHQTHRPTVHRLSVRRDTTANKACAHRASLQRSFKTSRGKPRARLLLQGTTASLWATFNTRRRTRASSVTRAWCDRNTQLHLAPFSRHLLSSQPSWFVSHQSPWFRLGLHSNNRVGLYPNNCLHLYRDATITLNDTSSPRSLTPITTLDC